MSRRLLIAGFLIFLLLLAGIFSFFYRPSTEPEEDERVDFRLQLREGEVVVRREGEVRWLLKVKQMEEAEKNIITCTDGVEGYYYRNGEIEYLIFGNRMTYDQGRGKLELEEDVRLETPEGDYLTSQLLIWEEDTDLLHSPGPVKLQSGNSLLWAREMTSDLDTMIFDFEGEIELRIPLTGEEEGVMNDEESF